MKYSEIHAHVEASKKFKEYAYYEERVHQYQKCFVMKLSFNYIFP